MSVALEAMTMWRSNPKGGVFKYIVHVWDILSDTPSLRSPQSISHNDSSPAGSLFSLDRTSEIIHRGRSYCIEYYTVLSVGWRWWWGVTFIGDVVDLIVREKPVVIQKISATIHLRFRECGENTGILLGINLDREPV